MTAPYAAQAAQHLAAAVTHVATVDLVTAPAADPIRLAATDLAVTFDESWAPHVQADVDLAVPDQAILDALDPRTNVRLVISAGYVYPDRLRDVQLLADLGLRGRPVRRPSNTLQLRAASDEARAQDYLKTSPGVPALAGVNEAVTWAAGAAVYPEAATVLSEYGAGHAPAAVLDLDVDAGRDLWGIVADVGNAAGVWIHCDGARRWRIRARPEAGAAVHHLATGPGGTITDSETDLDREAWANQVVIEYRFTDGAGAQQVIYGRAQVASGEYMPALVGYKGHHEIREYATTQDKANEAAANVLRNLVTRGRSMTLTAIAAYWLRPGDTVTVQLPTGGTESHIVRAVTFRPLSGLMTVTTRHPMNIDTETGE